MRECIKKCIYLILVFGLVAFFALDITTAVAEDGLTEAKNGVVQILSGFMDPEGTFRCVKTGSGFLVCNADGDTYLLTTNHCVLLTDEEKTAYCTGNSLKIDVASTQNVIKVVVKGDVTSDANIVAQSVENDYCLLSVSNVINEKSALRLGKNTELTTGTTVYAMGFEDDAASKGAEYTVVDVSVREGSVQNLESNQGGSIYLQHSAMITAGNSGGPLLNEEGYVVGMNNAAKSKPAEGAYFSFPINEIREVLDNYDVEYDSLERENTVKGLEALYADSMKNYKSGNYKKSSLADLENALKQADELKTRPKVSEEELKEISENLAEANKKLQKKLPVKTKIMVALGITNFILLVYFLKLFFAYRGESLQKDQIKDTRRKQKEENLESVRDVEIKSDVATLQFGEVISDKGTSKEIWNDEEDDSDKTVVLGMNRKRADRAEFLKNEESFLMREENAVLEKLDGSKSSLITQPVMSVGKSAGRVDIAILGNPAVSRVHAQIVWKEQKYFVRDLESANGTFLNSERIQENEDIEMKNGDKVRFADEEFEFRLF